MIGPIPNSRWPKRGHSVVFFGCFLYHNALSGHFLSLPHRSFAYILWFSIVCSVYVSASVCISSLFIFYFFWLFVYLFDCLFVCFVQIRVCLFNFILFYYFSFLLSLFKKVCFLISIPLCSFIITMPLLHL